MDNLVNANKSLKYSLLAPAASKQRIWEIDFLRGLCIVFMILDHLLFAFMILADVAVNWGVHSVPFFESLHAFGDWYWHWSVRLVVREIILFLFIFLTGISCVLSKDNTARFIKMSAAASLIFLATGLIDTFFNNSQGDIFIAFGILHILALNILLYIAAKRIKNSFSLFLFLGIIFTVPAFFIPYWYKPDFYYGSGLDILWMLTSEFVLLFVAAGFSLLFFIAWFASRFFTRKSRLPISKTDSAIKTFLPPVALLSFFVFLLTVRSFFECPFAADEFLMLITGRGRFGADYYGMFPFTGFFFLGAAFGKLLYNRRKSLLPKLDSRWNKYITFAGKNAIWVYLTHIVVTLLVVGIAALIAGYRFF